VVEYGVKIDPLISDFPAFQFEVFEVEVGEIGFELNYFLSIFID